jgi:hypothetical protein
MTARESSFKDVCGSAELVAVAFGALDVLVLVLVLARLTVLVEVAEVLKRDTVEVVILVVRTEVAVVRVKVFEDAIGLVSTLVEVDAVDDLVLVRPPLVEEAVLEVICVAEVEVLTSTFVIDWNVDVDREGRPVDVKRDGRVVDDFRDPVAAEVDRIAEGVARKEVVPRVFVVNRTRLERVVVESTLTPNSLVVAVASLPERVTVKVTGSVGHGVEDRVSLAPRVGWEVV